MIGETLTIGPDAPITVLTHRGNPVKLGIRAPAPDLDLIILNSALSEYERSN